MRRLLNFAAAIEVEQGPGYLPQWLRNQGFAEAPKSILLWHAFCLMLTELKLYRRASDVRQSKRRLLPAD